MFRNTDNTAPQLTFAALLLTGSLLLGPSVDAQQNSDEVIVIDGDMWSLATGSQAVPWEDANEYCDTLESGGFTDWRLPRLFQLEALHDPAAAGSIRGSFKLNDCCAWSSENLVDINPERKGNLPAPGGPPDGYYWGFLFDGGISYYSNGRFADGFAICVREPGEL